MIPAILGYKYCTGEATIFDIVRAEQIGHLWPKQGLNKNADRAPIIAKSQVIATLSSQILKPSSNEASYHTSV